MMMLSRAATSCYRPRAASSIVSTTSCTRRRRVVNDTLLGTTVARFSTQSRLWNVGGAPLSSSTRDVSFSPLFQHVQVRWKRKGGASAFSELRPPTRKQRKAHYRRKRKLYQERVGKHSAPGAKAGYRRQWNQETLSELLDYNNKDDALMEQSKLEYDFGDALVDDLMGNTASYTSLPTPKPTYLGHLHNKYYNQVRTKMELYNEEMQKLENGSVGDHDVLVEQLPMLPSDHEISLVLRAYRDRHGTKMKPIGIAKALKHLLTDLNLSTSCFGEETYTTLLTCCKTPKEARRIFRLMKEQQHEISSYSWAILVDIHAKLGDFEGCDAVFKEMVTEGGVLPSLPAFTSLLAACYKVANNGTIPHVIRDKASKLGWNRWKEMVIMGIEPDAMAYGALLRLIGARGQPERAINILEEMQTMGVKPTTLCFTSALKAVSRSQQTAVRFERGSSKKNRRREQITAHHGKLARKIVILAENAEVEQDDGFVAALIMCAGAAGDSATAKAILLASEVRRMDQLRTIGPEEHLRQIRGQSISGDGPRSLGVRGQPTGSLADGTRSLDSEHQSAMNALETTRGGGGALANNQKREKRYPDFEEREYGNDTRKLSALLFACSQAADSQGLGMQWAGRYSKGYLCENSLRLLTTRPQPKYFNPAIPGVSSTEVGMGSISWEDEEPEHLSKSLRRAKYRGIKQDDTVGQSMEDVDDAFFNMFKDDYKEKMDNDPLVDPMLLNKEEWEALKEAKAAEALRERMKQKSKEGTSSIQEATYRESDEEWYFDDDARKWRTRKRQVVESSASISIQADGNLETEESLRGDDTLASSGDDDDDDTELYFDHDERQWKSRPKLKQKKEESSFALEAAPATGPEAGVETDSGDDEFQTFFRELKEQIRVSGDEVEFDEDEARELFALTRSEDVDVATGDSEETGDEMTADTDEGDDMRARPDFDTFFAEIKDEWGITESEAREVYDSFDTSGEEKGDNLALEKQESDAQGPKPVLDLVNETTAEAETSVEATSRTEVEVEQVFDKKMNLHDDATNAKLAAIQEALPGLPQSRVKKILTTFEKSLNYPSMLELVPILRENMPDHLTSGWLKRRNVRNAEVVLQQAQEENVVDVPIMNGALQVKTSAGSLDEALAYHQDEFEKNGLTPTAYSDRLVLQMLVRNNRLPRALAFKQKIEEDGRHLDVISYGSLIEYYGNHGKLGSAMLILKECLNTHGAPPGAKSLAKLRLLCRQHDMETKLELEKLIGKDPMEWLRHGEANLKREMSFKGRRDVNLARNRMVQA